MKDLLQSIGILVTRDIKRRIRENKIQPPTNKSGTTLVKSAKLINSISYTVRANMVIVGTNMKYARILHEGGTIKPLSSKYLAIPLTKEAATRKPRDFDNTFIRKNVIFRSLGTNNVEALYALKAQVSIPARPYMTITADTDQHLRTLIINYIERHIERG